MARVGIARGVALAPGVSKNGRLYTTENIAKAHARLSARLADPDGLPIVMRTHHGAGDDSTRIAARVTKVSIDRAGRLAYEAEFADTAAGRDMAALTKAKDGKPFLGNVSISGQWIGELRTESFDGSTVETADDLEVNAIDFTANPGVVGATVSTETFESVLVPGGISESYVVELTPARPTPLDMPSAVRVLRETADRLEGAPSLPADGGAAEPTAPIEKEPTVAETTEPEAAAAPAETAPAVPAFDMAAFAAVIGESVKAAVTEALKTAPAPVAEASTTSEPITEAVSEPTAPSKDDVREGLKDVVRELLTENGLTATRKGAGLAEQTEAQPDASELWAKRGDLFAAAIAEKRKA